jgi:cobalt-zinc-cadmium resistance protein CzcA
LLDRIITYSISHKLIILLLTLGMAAFGMFSLTQLPIGAVPDVTNNQVQVITTTRNLATQDVEQFITYPVELEMANLPGVKEIRSVSKFGLSVVTIVFDDDMGTYLPRQLIAEKLKTAEERIPQGFGKPFMGPVSTGLGEIYQYIIDVEPGYEDRYSITDLRTIQDWIVKRQLSGIPGVVEVNTWGGYLKQYEVAVNPERLRAMQLSVGAVFEAIQKNNHVAGGAYIEKNQQSYFIRGEGLVTSLEGIASIVVDRREGVPILVEDVAEVRFGHATRFGAITGNGEGEKVLGQVMMLKDANANAVISAVKERVEQIESSLPEGVQINAFLERSGLIGRTTMTIAENLILGCLIVILVVVLLLGNLRSGLVVASVIPLSLLFALSMMLLFGIDANLMSLGAIDFGIIIDGAVIIVEFISYRISQAQDRLTGLDKAEKRKVIDQISEQGASRMMHSAIFGQLIIIIVFIPILSLQGVEGKMFIPMASTFCFALLGAMILCFTYVPVVSALLITPRSKKETNFSTRFIAWLHKLYQPVLLRALRWRFALLAMALALLVGCGWIFSRMGSEFVPTLDEGDFVIQPVLKTGTSLSETIELITRMEQILKTFPEVEQVVTRIGAAEVPTDPMSMEETDVIITLRPPNEWETAKSKDELAEHFKEALSILPGIEYEFTQPIEMRFNELITGVRADLAIKVFGEDLDILYKKALAIKAAIKDVPGAADVTVEKVAGLPQMRVRYDRAKIARYGLNVVDLNEVLSAGFAGITAGTVFEGEKQFDLVLRFDLDHRNDISDLQNAPIVLPDGSSLPLSEFADISYATGPAKISRDDTRRRVVVGVNVRGRDLQSVVDDVRAIIQREVRFPPGYAVSYGGQFENLQSARQRLLYAVPISLFLIFIMLYFAFSSVKEALLIYSAIPLASVGGILALYLRGMPFSISAGVGFIALFGIAVLNGIVLIEQFKELKQQGYDNVYRRVLLGTRQRMRPVLLTASAAALGFLPMALSTSAGAEVQRPLATVVVGGLISATLLTLLVLPVLYSLFDRSNPGKVPARSLMVLLFATCSLSSQAQEAPQVLDQQAVLEWARKQNASLKAADSRVEAARQRQGTVWRFEPTQFYYHFDQANIAENDLPLRVGGVSQQIPFPTVFGARKKLQASRQQQQEVRYRLEARILDKMVSQGYWSVVYHKERSRRYADLDSLYQGLWDIARRRYDLGEIAYLDLLTIESQAKQMAGQKAQAEAGIDLAYAQLNSWLQAETPWRVQDERLIRLPMSLPDTVQHPGKALRQAALNESEGRIRLEKQQRLPDLELEYFLGNNNGPAARLYPGVQAGLSVPLLLGAQRAEIRALQAEQASLKWEARAFSREQRSRYRELLAQLRQQEISLQVYRQEGQRLAQALLVNAEKAFRAGEIDLTQSLLLLERAQRIELQYLEDLFLYNLTVLELKYL